MEGIATDKNKGEGLLQTQPPAEETQDPSPVSDARPESATVGFPILGRSDSMRTLESIDDAIQQSEVLVHLGDNWDGEGSARYSTATWMRATDFVRGGAVRLWEEYSKGIDTPEFLPGPDGAIDIEWSTSGRELIIRIPAEKSTQAEYYGHQAGCFSIKGTFDVACPDSIWLLTWIAK